MCGGLRNLAKPYRDVVQPGLQASHDCTLPVLSPDRAMPPEGQPSPTGPTGVTVLPIALGDNVSVMRLGDCNRDTRATERTVTR